MDRRTQMHYNIRKNKKYYMNEYCGKEIIFK